MKAKLRVLVAVLGLLYVTAPALAHHGFDTEYDSKKKISLTGVVTKVSWTNPHMHIYIDVKDEKGTVTNWNLELSSPNNARREGWSKDDLMPGDKVNFEANPGRLVESRAAMRLITKVGETKPIFKGTNPEAQN